MYRHYESSEEVFVDREEHIEWMNDALERCKDKSVVLHLKGIGGIGKSSLLNHWVNTHEKTIRLDCEQYSEFYQRLNMLAKGVVLQGVKLQRFDILWQIRQRFVEGVEPVREEGREWAKEVVMLIPFVGTLASIGSAISAVGTKVTPKLKGKYSTVGKWLQETLGKNHIEELLQILWKDPRRAEFLYLEAFLEDINNRADSSTPLLFLLDHFEYVDDTKAQWKYQRQKINETQLWTIFLSSLTNCVGVLASRRAASDGKLIEVEESELTELDRDSCFEMLELQNITDQKLQEKIVSVSGGNPFVIDAICDMINTRDVTVSDIEDLRADTLAGVRLKVWRKLFSEAGGLHNLINRTGIVPYFNERIMRIISPGLTPDSWDRLRRLSFVNIRSNGTFVLHDLAEDMVHAELADSLGNLVDEVSKLLEEKYDEESDITLLGLAFSVRALKKPKKILTDFYDIWNNLSWQNKYQEGIAFCDSTEFRTEEGRAFLKISKAHHLIFADRIADGEHIIKEALEEFERITTITDNERKRYLALTMKTLATLYMRTGRGVEADNRFEEAIALAKDVNEEPPVHLPPGFTTYELSLYLWWYGNHLEEMNRLKQAEEAFNEAIEKWESWAGQVDEQKAQSERRLLSYCQLNLCFVWMRMGRLSDAEVMCKSIIENVQEPHLIGTIYEYLYMICNRMNKPVEALEWSEKAIQAFNEMPENVITVIDVHNKNAAALHDLGRYHDALSKTNEALEIARKSMERTPELYSGRVAYSLWIKAVLLRQTGRVLEAEKTYREIFQIYKKMGNRDPDKMFWSLNDRGVLFFKTEKIPKAERDFSEGLELARRMCEKSPEVFMHTRAVALILNNLGNLYFATGRISKAQEAFEEALVIIDKLSKISIEMVKRGKSAVLNNLGALLISLGEPSEAKAKLTESLSIRKELDDDGIGYHKVRICSTLNNLGLLHLKRNEYSEALGCFQEATILLEKIASETTLDCRDDLRCVLINQHITLSKIDSDNEMSEHIWKKLRKLGVKKEEPESWILDFLEFD